MRTGRVRRLLMVVAGLAVGTGAGGALGLVIQDDPSPDPSPLRIERPADTTPSPEPEPRPLTPDTLLVWTPGGLPPGFGRGVAALPGVDRAVTVASGLAWLDGAVSADGDAVEGPPAGFRIPIEVAAADPGVYGPFLAPADRALLPRLGGGEAALGETAAAIRGVGAGATLRFGDIALRVGGVLPDASIGAHEIFVSRTTAARLGIDRDRYVLVDPAAGASRERLSERIRGLLPAGTVARIRGPGETPFFRQGDAVLAQVRLKDLFDEFAARPHPDGSIDMDPSWVSRNIVSASVPILGTVRCNRAVIPQLRGALGELADRGLAHLVDPSGYGGCFSPRFVNRDPAAGISHHAWGIAIDVNVPDNPFGATPHQDPRLVAAFERWGFTWGGRWLRPDGMHFEFLRRAP